MKIEKIYYLDSTWVKTKDMIKELKKIAPRGVSPYYDRVQELITQLEA